MVKATKRMLTNVCNSLTRSEIMLMWLKVPRWLCFRGTVMKNVLQSLEYSGSSFWGDDTPFNPGKMYLAFPNQMFLLVVPWGHNHAFCLEKTTWCMLTAATITWRSSHFSDVSTFFWNVRKKHVNKLNANVSRSSSSYRCTDACHNIAERENRHVLGSIHPAHAQPLRSHPLDHCDVVVTGETAGECCKPNKTNTSNILIQPFFKTVWRSQLSCSGAAIHGDHMEPNSGINLSHLVRNSANMEI